VREHGQSSGPCQDLDNPARLVGLIKSRRHPPLLGQNFEWLECRDNVMMKSHEGNVSNELNSSKGKMMKVNSFVKSKIRDVAL
jgi:hypothetical protein